MYTSDFLTILLLAASSLASPATRWSTATVTPSSTIIPIAAIEVRQLGSRSLEMDLTSWSLTSQNTMLPTYTPSGASISISNAASSTQSLASVKVPTEYPEDKHHAGSVGFLVALGLVVGGALFGAVVFALCRWHRPRYGDGDEENPRRKIPELPDDHPARAFGAGRHYSQNGEIQDTGGLVRATAAPG